MAVTLDDYIPCAQLSARQGFLITRTLSLLPGWRIELQGKGVDMTRNEILQVTHVNFSEFLALWLDHVRDQGLGALVFMLEEASGDGDEIQCEYWTLSELRDYVRRMQECDEVVYKWLKNAEREGGYPIVIFSPGSEPDCEQLQFSCVREAQVS